MSIFRVNWGKRMLALLLCMAIALPMFPQMVHAVDVSSSGTKIAEGVYGFGNYLFDSTSTSQIKLTPVSIDYQKDSEKVRFTDQSGANNYTSKTDWLFQDDKIALKSATYDYIMSYSAASGSSSQKTTGSLTYGTSGALNTYYTDGDGNIIIDHSARDNALWLLKQYRQMNLGTTLGAGKHFTPYNEVHAANASHSVAWAENAGERFGEQMLMGIELQKGGDSTYGNYWYGGVYRWLHYSNPNAPFSNATVTGKEFGDTDEGTTRSRYVLEWIEDSSDTVNGGYFLIYHNQGYINGTRNFYLNFLYCDENGNWGVEHFFGNVDTLKNEIRAGQHNEWKIDLYRYKQTGEHKVIAYDGCYTTYNVDLNTPEESVLNHIQDNIRVFDANTNQLIPYGENKVGCYWLDTSEINTSVPTSQHVYVNYKNDNNTITALKVDVNVLGEYTFENTDGEPVTTGHISMHSRTGLTVYDGNAADANPITFDVDGTSVELKVNMLYVQDQYGVYSHFDTSKSGTYTGVMVRYNNRNIGTIDITVASGTIVSHIPGTGEPGAVTVNKVGTTSELDFSKDGEANIQLSASALPATKDVDLIFMLDLSSSMRYPTTDQTGLPASKEVCGPFYAENYTQNTAWDGTKWTNSRMYALEQALTKVVTDLQAKAAANNMDVNIAIADFGDLDHYDFEGATILGNDHWAKRWPHLDGDADNIWDINMNPDIHGNNKDGFIEIPNHLNYVLGGLGYACRPFQMHEWKYWSKEYATGTEGVSPYFWGKKAPYVYTGANLSKDYKDGTVNSLTDAFSSLNDVAAQMNTNDGGILKNLRISNSAMLGTNYDVGLEYMYKLAYQRQQDNISAGKDREIICIFMSDGTAMQYNYFSGHANSTSWKDWLTGSIKASDTELDVLKQEYSWDLTDTGNDGLDHFAQMNPVVRELLSALHQQRQTRALNSSAANLLDQNGNRYARPCTCPGAAGDDFFRCTGISDWYTLFRLLHHNKDNGNIKADPELVSALKALLKDKYSGDLRTDIVKALTTADNDLYQTYSPYSYFYNANGENWWANAIKGSTDQIFPVINKYAKGDTYIEGDRNPLNYNGEIVNPDSPHPTNGFSTNTGLALDGKDYISGFAGLGLKLYTVGFSLLDDYVLDVATAETVLKSICTAPDGYYFSANNRDTLSNSLNVIIDNSSLGATQAFYVDPMGPNYDLSTENDDHIWVYKEVNDEKQFIEKISFDTSDSSDKKAYTAYYVDNVWTEFEADIWDDATGLIKGNRVFYNTNKYVDESNKGEFILEGLDSTGRTFTMTAESFFWSIGNLTSEPIVMEYQVDLEGAMDPDHAVNKTGVRKYYDTNGTTVLTYKDYLENYNQKETDIPKYPWGADKVVIDFGIPVDITVLDNGFYEKLETGVFNAEIIGVLLGGISDDDIEYKHGTTTEPSGYGQTANGLYGDMTISGQKLRYTPKKNSQGNMAMTTCEVFGFVVKDTTTGKFYYCNITVIPATSIYYEDSFLDFEVYQNHAAQGQTPDWQKSDLVWSDNYTDMGVTDFSNVVQNDDRVGLGNIYGYDGAYTNMTKYSLGKAKKITVDANTYATATFTFWGTGFDVISLSDSTTGVVMVSVKNSNGQTIRNLLVDTYYGYKFEDGKWIVDENKWSETSPDSNALYQVPVIKVDMDGYQKDGVTYGYGQYTVEIYVGYSPYMDHNGKNTSYDFYLDAIRIYNPADQGVFNENDTPNTVTQDAYVSDKERAPVYEELRNKLIESNAFDQNDVINGVVFIDGIPQLTDGTADGNAQHFNKPAKIATYAQYGPNNEVYLSAGQAVAFAVSNDASIDSIHLAMKSVGDSAVDARFSYYDPESDALVVFKEFAGELSIKTATDLYYDISDDVLRGKIMVIENAGGGMLSVTNIKTTHKDTAKAASAVGGMNDSDVTYMLLRLNGARLPDAEQSPATGDTNLVFVAVTAMTACLMMLAVLALSGNRRKKA